LGALATLAAVGTTQITDASVTNAKLAGSIALSKLAADATNLGKFIRYNPITGAAEAAVPGADTSKLVQAFPTRSGGRGPYSLCPAFLMQDGSIRIFGAAGLLGNQDQGGQHVYHPVPAAIDGFSGKTVAKIYIAGSSGYVLTTDGNVFAWGNNSNGQLGLGDTTNRSIATLISYFSSNSITVNDIILPQGPDSNQSSAFFLTSTGAIYACGYNNAGQLGDTSTTDRSTPVRCGTLSSMIGASCSNPSSMHVYAWDASGNLYAWGYNADGQLGDGTTTNRSAPVLITGMPNTAQAQATANYDGASHHGSGIVMNTSGAVFGTGYNGYGQLGVNDTSNRSAWTAASTAGGALPAAVEVFAVGGGIGSHFFRDGSGNIYGAGNNAAGQLGDTTTTNRSLFTKITAITGIVKLACIGYSYNGVATSMAALTSGGVLYTWGYNAQGQLGLNSTTNVLTPTIPDIPQGLAGDTILDVMGFGRNGSGQFIALLLTSGRVLASGALTTVGPATRVYPNTTQNNRLMPMIFA
jgi:alpha-tubulin suppressor-like RCC1 family protein